MAEYTFGRFEKACLDNGVRLHPNLTLAVQNGLRSGVTVEPGEMFSAVNAAANMIQRAEALPSDGPIPPLEIDEQDIAAQTLWHFLNGGHPASEKPAVNWELPMGTGSGDACASTEGRFATAIRQIGKPGQPIRGRVYKHMYNFQVVANQGKAVAIRKDRDLGVRNTLVLEPVRLLNADQQTELICPPGAVLRTPLVSEYAHYNDEFFQEVITPEHVLRGLFLRLSAFALAPKQRRRDFNPSLEMLASNAHVHKWWGVDRIKSVAQSFVDSHS